jgi:hypothetical protein
VRTALTSLPWVRQVQVDFDRQQAIVTAIADLFDQEALLRVLEKKGFPAKVLKEGGGS